MGGSTYEIQEEREADELENGNEDSGSVSDEFAATEDTGKVLDQLSRELISAPAERMPDAGVNASYFKALRRANHHFDPNMQGSKRREVLGIPAAPSSTSSSRDRDSMERANGEAGGHQRIGHGEKSPSSSSVGTGSMKDAVQEEANSMIKDLPSKTIRAYLIERYLTDLQPMFPTLHVPTFKRQIQELEEVLDGSNQGVLDLSILALLFAVLQGMCDCLSLEDMKGIGLAKTLAEAIPLLEKLHNHMSRLLIIDRFWLNPTLSGIQAFSEFLEKGRAKKTGWKLINAILLSSSVISRHYYFNRNLHKHYSGQNLMVMRL